MASNCLETRHSQSICQNLWIKRPCKSFIDLNDEINYWPGDFSGGNTCIPYPPLWGHLITFKRMDSILLIDPCLITRVTKWYQWILKPIQIHPYSEGWRTGNTAQTFLRFSKLKSGDWAGDYE